MASKAKNGPSMDYDRFLNSIAANREISPLRNIWAIQNSGGPSMISLGTGTPNSSCFPFESITVQTKDGRAIVLQGDELNIALAYTDSRGYPPLIDWLLQLQKRLHDPPYARHRPELNELIVIPGSEDGQCKVLEMVLEPGDPVLVSEPAYPGILSAMKALSVEFLVVQTDSQGVRPDSMEQLLADFEKREKNGNNRRPKVMIIQPNHCNPTGVCTTLERRKSIYRLACQYDILIVEDDPYHFLTFGPKPLPEPSMLALDTEGRVIRLESYSKIISGGLRLGTLSGPKPLVDRIVMHVSCSSLHASTLSQTILHNFLKDRSQDDFLDHAVSVGRFYQDRCQSMLKAADRYLTGLAEWNEPSGGMFLWMKVHGIKDTHKMMMKKGPEMKVMLAPGCLFMCDESRHTSYLRASFSWASEDEMNEGFRRLAEMIKQEIDTYRQG